MDGSSTRPYGAEDAIEITDKINDLKVSHSTDIVAG
jgi:hypothetical protein